MVIMDLYTFFFHCFLLSYPLIPHRLWILLWMKSNSVPNIDMVRFFTFYIDHAGSHFNDPHKEICEPQFLAVSLPPKDRHIVFLAKDRLQIICQYPFQ